MTTLERKLWIESYQSKENPSQAEQDIFETVEFWQHRVDAGESRQSMISRGYDPDIFNEYCMTASSNWRELDSHYDQTNKLHQAICRFKRQRAQAIVNSEDPGAVPEKVIKYFSPASRRAANSGAVRNPQTRRRSTSGTGFSAAHNKKAASWEKAAQPVSSAQCNGWLLPTIVTGAVFALWGMVFQNIAPEETGFIITVLRWFGVGLDMLTNAAVVLSICGKIMETRGKTLTGFMSIYYRFLDFTYMAVRHPFQTTGKVISVLGKTPLALMQLVWLPICWLGMLIGGLVIILVAGIIRAVTDYFTPRKYRYY